MAAAKTFGIDRQGTTLIIVPSQDLGSLAEMELERELADILRLIDDPTVQRVVIDFEQVPYFGSTMISVLIKVWKTTQARGGRLVLCNLSPREKDILRVMRLHAMWPCYASRAESLALTP